MKKLVLLFIVMLLVSIMAVHAEGIDLKGMTTEELIELNLMVTEELHSRDSIVDSYLYQGYYTVGKDLDEGRYVFKCVKVLDEKYNYGTITVKCTDKTHFSSHANMMLGHEWSVNLVNGDYVSLLLMDCAITKVD